LPEITSTKRLARRHISRISARAPESPGQGYYSYTVGAWRIIALNSEIDVRGTSSQVVWLRGELITSNARCTAVIFHRPRFSSGEHGDNPDMSDVWQVLYDNNADVVISGHDHHYERFAAMDADGRANSSRGIRQFVVGTGGAGLRPPTRMRPNSEITGVSWGVISFTLATTATRGTSYRPATDLPTPARTGVTESLITDR
jgi:hypothetical protein